MRRPCGALTTQALRKKETDKKQTIRFWKLKGVPGGAVIKTLPASAGDSRDASSIPGLGRFPGVGKNTTIEMKNKYLLTTHK